MPNSMFSVRFGRFSGEFGRVTARILARCNQVNILMTGPNEPGIPPHVPKRVYHIQTLQIDRDIVEISGRYLDITTGY